jgi:hypothetical protein
VHDALVRVRDDLEVSLRCSPHPPGRSRKRVWSLGGLNQAAGRATCMARDRYVVRVWLAVTFHASSGGNHVGVIFLRQSYVCALHLAKPGTQFAAKLNSPPFLPDFEGGVALLKWSWGARFIASPLRWPVVLASELPSSPLVTS